MITRGMVVLGIMWVAFTVIVVTGAASFAVFIVPTVATAIWGIATSK